MSTSNFSSGLSTQNLRTQLDSEIKYCSAYLDRWAPVPKDAGHRFAFLALRKGETKGW